MSKRQPLPHFKVNFDYLQQSTADTSSGYRLVSAATIHMCLAALDHMHFNRYWQVTDGGHMSPEQIIAKNDMVDAAICELLEAVGLPPIPDDLITPQSAYGGSCGDFEEELEDDDMPIIHINGVAYLTEDCGCNTRFYRLKEAQLSIDNETGGVTILPEADTEPGISFASIADEYQACFAGKAVPYLLDRAYEFVETYQDMLESGLDNLMGGLDEWLDIGGTVVDILGNTEGGFVDILRGYDMTDIQTAYNDTTFRATMVDRWTADGPLNRAALRSWVDTAPALVNDIPVRQFLQQWTGLSLIAGYNDQLRVYAAECESGQDLDDVNADVLGYEAVDFVHNGYTYPLYVIEDDQLLTTTNQHYWLPDVGEPITAAFCDVTIIGTTTITFDIFVNERFYSILGQYTGRAGCADAATEAAVEAYTGQAWTVEYGSIAHHDPRATAYPTNAAHQLRINKTILVGTPVAV